MVEKVTEYIERKKLLRGGESLLLSMSAGKDSMAMLHMFFSLKKTYRLSLGIFHLNHMMRGNEADLDEEMLQNRARELQIPFFFERVDFPAILKDGGSFEERARKERYRLINKTMTREGFDLVATAHNRDDNIETLLMRILGGTGLHGLQGIAPRRDRVIHPLLPLSAAEIYRYCESNRIDWREDASNRDTHYLRNYLRHTVIPMVEERFSRYRDALEGLSALAGENLTLLDRVIKEQWGEVLTAAGEKQVLRSERIDRDPELLKHVVAKALQGRRDTYAGQGRIDEIMKRYYREGSHRVLYEKPGLCVKKTIDSGKRVIVFFEPDSELSCAPQWDVELIFPGEKPEIIDISRAGGPPMAIEICRVDYTFFIDNKASRDYIFVTIDDPGVSLNIRNRRRGDRMKFSYGGKKIKKIFIEKKLDNEIKNCVPLLTVDNTIVAVMCGFISETDNCIADFHLVTEKSPFILALRKQNRAIETPRPSPPG